jgi:UDP-glucose 4-epimerase
MNKKIIITGATGFIGGHTAKVFKQAGYTVIGVDRTYTIPETTQYLDQILIDDFVDATVNAATINEVDAIIHCAGTSLVGPSVKNPHLYYWNNSSKTNDMLEKLHKDGWHGKIVFSSSAATYGIPPGNRPLKESDSQSPISPYGWSKLFCEQIISDHCTAYGFKGIALRYFNACGCDPDSTIGHVADDTHMIPRVLSAFNNNQTFSLYGDDYSTPDGTCIRDYLHVMDIAHAHLESVCLAESMKPSDFRAYNLGTGSGFSNKEIIQACAWAVRKKIDFRVVDRRIGDPDFLVADSTRFQTDTSWHPRFSDVNTIVETAWLWQQRYPRVLD